MALSIIVTLLAAGVRSGTAILLATLGEICTERAGVLNLGVEGMMLMGAMTGYGAAHATGNAWVGLLAGMLVGGGFSLLHAFITVTLRADQVVSGLALSFLGSGMSAVLGAPLTDVKTAPKLPAFDIPGLAQIPVIGPIFFQHNVIVYIAFLLAPVIWFYIYRTRPGLEMRAIGEYPAAADVQGINVYAQRYFYVFVGGLFSGMGGAALSLAITPLWLDGMTAGQGWIAVGMVIFARWDPMLALVGAYLFGAIARLPLDLQNIEFFKGFPQYGYFFKMLPYLFTIFVLIFSARSAMRRRLGAPAALGLPYVREERGR